MCGMKRLRGNRNANAVAQMSKSNAVQPCLVLRGTTAHNQMKSAIQYIAAENLVDV